MKMTAQPLVQAQGLTKRYAKVTALEDLNLELSSGIIGLIGANGAGKSTFIKLILGLIEPTSGTVRVMGMDAIGRGHEVRQFVGYMPEHECLMPDVSATEFVAHMGQVSGLPRSASRERTAEILRHVGLFEARYRKIAGYSTGMKQRVKLAQALVHDPQLVLLDEPTNGLDPEGREEMLNLIRRIGTDFGMTVILSSHLLSEIERVCDHLVEIEMGRLVRSAPISDLTAATRHLLVEVEGDIEPLARYLWERRFACEVNDHYLVVERDDEDLVLDAIRDGAVEKGLGLMRIEQGRRRLEELFTGAQAANADANDG
jgi:ABC-2 type transport system ATP-binding protein